MTEQEYFAQFAGEEFIPEPEPEKPLPLPKLPQEFIRMVKGAIRGYLGMLGKNERDYDWQMDDLTVYCDDSQWKFVCDILDMVTGSKTKQAAYAILDAEVARIKA